MCRRETGSVQRTQGLRTGRGLGPAERVHRYTQLRQVRLQPAPLADTHSLAPNLQIRNLGPNLQMHSLGPTCRYAILAPTCKCTVLAQLADTQSWPQPANAQSWPQPANAQSCLCVCMGATLPAGGGNRFLKISKPADSGF